MAALTPEEMDKRLFVRFSTIPKKNEAKSKEAGRPIFEDVEYIEILTPGERDYPHRPVREGDKERFATQYERWKRTGEGEALEGTPLSEWPGITRSLVEELRFFNVRTVEQLAGMADSNCQKIMGGQTWKQKARDYLERAQANAPMEKMNAELATRDNEIATLKAQMKELLAEKQAQRSTTRRAKEEA